MLLLFRGVNWPSTGGIGLGTRSGSCRHGRANARRGRLGGAEPGRARDLVDRVVGGLEEPAHDLDSHQLDVCGRRAADLVAEDPCEVPRAHRDTGREPLDGVIRLGMLDDPVLELAQRVARGELRAELRAELRLPARSLHEQHELACRHQRDVAAEVVFDEREREIHARGHARGRPDVAVPHEDRIGVDVDARVVARELAAPRPMRRRAPAVEQPGRAEHERAGADRRDPPAPRRGRAAPTQRARHRRAAARAPSPPTTTSVSIGPGPTRSARSATIAGPRRRRDRPGRRGRDLDPVGVGLAAGPARDLGGGGEHLVRPDEVEGDDAREDDEHDAAAHRLIVRDRAAWQQ